MTTPDPASLTPDQQHEIKLKSAMTAFKKRIKVIRLDQESRLGGGRPTTGGKKSDVDAIIPPNQFPREVWEELAKQGKLKNTGGGFYSLP